ncbi:MAG: AraC family transcriptional regulator [Eubacteriales bacterium]|nr:AraC family transcriptional regulator [Eubacteriales bacterium]
MFETRYEEYGKLSENMPCVFLPDIKRTKFFCNKLTNWHENLEIQLCTFGQGYVLLNGEKREMQKGDIIVVNSNVVHYTGADEDMKYTCLIIDSALCKLALIDHTTLYFDSLIKSPVIVKTFEEIEAIYNSSDICKTALLQTAVLKILIELRKNHTVFEKNLPKINRHFEEIKKTIKYIRENYNEKITLESLAKMVYHDKFSLSKKFKEVTGSTIIEYINSYRCEKAIELIREGSAINEAAVRCGFNNMSFFTRTFKARTGKLPSEYRK